MNSLITKTTKYKAKQNRTFIFVVYDIGILKQTIVGCDCWVVKRVILVPVLQKVYVFVLFILSLSVSGVLQQHNMHYKNIKLVYSATNFK